jgi:NAD(P)-dependent dehydrogenase (short-subunit alcohol dehydrogenase family)
VKRLEGRVALVTGAASGIGKATAQRLASEGASVMITDISDDAGSAVAAELAASGANTGYRRLDVTSEADWQAAVAATLDAFGGLDVLVNNAGVSGGPDPIESISLASWEQSIAILQTGVFLGMKHAAPALLQSRHASVINISSIFGASGGFGTSPAYHAAKGAVRILTKTVALHWAELGVRVNSVHPGFIDTPLLGGAGSANLPESAEVRRAILDSTPMRRLGRPEEVAAGVAYLASDDASFVTGTELYIDGGFMAR